VAIVPLVPWMQLPRAEREMALNYPTGDFLQWGIRLGVRVAPPWGGPCRCVSAGTINHGSSWKDAMRGHGQAWTVTTRLALGPYHISMQPKYGVVGEKANICLHSLSGV